MSVPQPIVNAARIRRRLDLLSIDIVELEIQQIAGHPSDASVPGRRQALELEAQRLQARLTRLTQ